MYKHNKLSILFIILIVPLLFLGCASNQPKPLQYPTWYTKLYTDTNIILYATAEGYSEKEAIASALNDIASKISISVESSFTSTTQSSTDSYSKSSYQNIQNNVKKIDFTSYTVLNKEKLPTGKYIVLVKVHKDILATSLQFKIENDIKKYKDIISNRYSNITSKIKKYQQVSLEIKNSESSIYILQSLDNLLDAQSYFATLNDLTNKINSFNNEIQFSVSSNGTGKEFKEELSSILTVKGFSIVTKNADVHLNLNVSKQELTSLGYKILKVVINLEAKDNNTIIAKEKIIVGGKSISNFNQANAFALQNFSHKIIQEDILKNLLGI